MRKTSGNIFLGHLGHYVKSVQIRSFFWSVFSRIQSDFTKIYGDLRSESLCSVRIWEKTDQKKLLIWTLFTQGDRVSFSYFPKIALDDGR